MIDALTTPPAPDDTNQEPDDRVQDEAPPKPSSWAQVKDTIYYRALSRQAKWLWILLGLTVAVLLIVTATVLTTKAIFDDAIIAGTADIDELVGSLYFLAAMGLIFGLALRQIGSRVVYQLEFDLRTWLYDELQKVDPKALDKLSAGQLVTRALTDLSFLEGLTAVLPVLLVGGVIVTAIAIVMVIVNPLMGLLTAAAVPMNLLIVKRIATRLRAMSWMSLHRRAEVTATIDEAVRGIRVVKSFAREETERAAVERTAGAAYDIAVARVRVLARYGIPVKAIPALLTAALIFLGARATVDGSFTIGALVIYLGFAALFTSLASQVDEYVSAWQFAQSGSGRIFDLIAGAQDPTPGLALPDVHTGLVLDHATALGFDGTPYGPAIVANVPSGGWLVLTGPPACGTSAVARSIVGLDSLAAGRIVLDGLDLSTVDSVALRRQARLLEAEPFLFGRTVRENLEMAAHAADGIQLTDDVLWAALAAAGADEFVRELDGGLDAGVGDRGLTLSGGQRQRLALARALVTSPRVLVLDDALGAVNPNLERQILQRVRAHAPDTTVVLVSRRDGPLAVADQQVVFPLMASRPVGDDGAGGFDAPTDEKVLALVEAMDVSHSVPPVTEAEATDDTAPPAPLSILSPLRWRILWAAFLLVILTVATLAPSMLLALAVDGIRNDDAGPAAQVALVLIPIAAVLAVVNYGLRLAVTIVNESVLYLLRRRVFQRLSRLGVDYYDRELPGRVASRVVYDLDRITEFVNTGVFPLLTGLFIFVGALVAIAVVSGTTFLAIAPFLPVIIVMTMIQIPIAQRAYDRARDDLGFVVERFHEDFTGRHVIAGFGAEDRARIGFLDTSWELRQARKKATTVANVYLAGVEFVSALATAALIHRAGNLAIVDGVTTVGTVVLLQVLLTQALAPLPTLSNVLQTYLNARASFRTLGAPFEAPVLPVAQEATVDCPSFSGAVRFDGVDFAYPGTARTVLTDVTLELPAGALVAVVGPTGAGKSSVAKLLARVYDPDGGRVLLDGQDLRSFDLRSYRRRLGIVPQDAFCFAGTVRTNIAFGRPEATDHECIEALAAAGGSHVLDVLADGLDTVVLENGRNLSPVVRQWLALARAWLIEPDLLLLDEATSGLPPEEEQRVVDRLRAAPVTAVVITHRQAVADRADLVLVVQDGRVVQSGPPETLRTEAGPFARLWDSPTDDEDDELAAALT